MSRPRSVSRGSFRRKRRRAAHSADPPPSHPPPQSRGPRDLCDQTTFGRRATAADVLVAYASTSSSSSFSDIANSLSTADNSVGIDNEYDDDEYDDVTWTSTSMTTTPSSGQVRTEIRPFVNDAWYWWWRNAPPPPPPPPPPSPPPSSSAKCNTVERQMKKLIHNSFTTTF